MANETLAGKTAIVTGASRGIGQAIAAALVEAGAEVLLTARTQEAADEAAAALGPRAVGFAAHVADEEAAAACFEFATERFGGLDILVNNAGTNPAFGPLVEQDHARFAKLFDINLWGPLLWTRLAWETSLAERGGAVVNVASLGGLVVGPNLGLYHASKAALIHITRHQAQELAPGVRVNAVAPGVVRTRLAEALWKEHEDLVNGSTPLGRIGEPEDIGAAVSFLVSDAASWITGETLVIDGGQILGASGPSSGAHQA